MIYSFSNQDEANKFVANKMFSALQKSKKNFHCVLTGGRSPHAIYAEFSKIARISQLALLRLHVWLSDERSVETNAPLSNANMLRNTLLSTLPIPESHIHFSTSIEQLNQSILDYKINLFDFTLLSVGDDGHIASIFPNRLISFLNAYINIERPTHIEPKVDRVSMTIPRLNATRKGYVLVYGQHKIDFFLNHYQNQSTIAPFTYLDPKKFDFILAE